MTTAPDIRGEVHVEVCNHVACIMDLLGQKELLRRWAVMPSDDVLSPDMQEAIQLTAGRIHTWRQLFEKFFAEFNKPRIPEFQLRLLPTHIQELYYRVRDVRLKSQQFSDTFVHYAPLVTSKRERTVFPLLGTVIAASISMLMSVAEGVPLRGGIAAGVGVELSEHNFYGPVLATAYHLESTVAEYPRVVVDRSVVEALTAASEPATRSDESSTPFDSIMRGLAELCKSMIISDTDGCMVVDYGGSATRTLLKQCGIDDIELLRKAQSFANTELDRVRKDENKKLASRYQRLSEYLRRGNAP